MQEDYSQKICILISAGGRGGGGKVNMGTQCSCTSLALIYINNFMEVGKLQNGLHFTSSK
jgi:hypothetical protein